MPLTFLIGFMGFGKKLAHKLKVPFIDLDELVVAQTNAGSVKDLIESRGIDFFRQSESEVLKNIDTENALVSTGGGTPCYFNNIAWMKSRGVVVFLNPDEGVIYSRLKTTKLDERPLLKDLSDEGLKAFIHHKLQERLPYYTQAHITFDPIHEKMDVLVEKLGKV